MKLQSICGWPNLYSTTENIFSAAANDKQHSKVQQFFVQNFLRHDDRVRDSNLFFSIQSLKSFPQLLPRFPQTFRNHFRVSNYGHEVGVAIPARHEVKMQMRVDAGAGGFADVHADVEAVRRHHFFQRGRGILQQRHHLLILCRG